MIDVKGLKDLRSTVWNTLNHLVCKGALQESAFALFAASPYAPAHSSQPLGTHSVLGQLPRAFHSSVLVPSQ